MKKIVLYLIFILFIFFSAAAAQDAEGEETKPVIPRVYLINLAEPGTTDLTPGMQPVKFYMMFRSKGRNFIWPAVISPDETSESDLSVIFYKDESFAEEQKVTVGDAWGAHSEYCLHAADEGTGLEDSAAETEKEEAAAGDRFPVEVYLDNEYLRDYYWIYPQYDPRVIYAIDIPFQSGPDKVMDAGFNLYAEPMNFTIFLKLNTGQQEQRSMPIISNANNENDGIIVFCAGDGTDEYTMFFAGEHTYEALYARDDDGYAYITIRKQDDEYTFYGKSMDDRKQIVSPIHTEVATNLAIGGRFYLWDDGGISVSDYYTGTIEWCRIYNEALKDEEIADILAGMKTE